MNILNLIFPPVCVVCNGILKKGEKHICVECRKRLPRVTEPFCQKCGKPIFALEQTYCLDCEKNIQKSALEKGRALWLYDEQMKHAMAQIKYQGIQEHIDFFAEQVVESFSREIERWKVERLVPVPLFWRRRWFRGYNQAELLAEGIGKRLQIPVLSNVLQRGKQTKPQKGLLPEQRRQNVSSAFCISLEKRNELTGVKTVLLVDDIYTTGATLEACGRVLHEAGVQRVYFICLCIGRDF